MIESTILRDVRFGWRSLMRARAFTSTALVALALGIGGTTAIFSVVDAVLLRPLPLGDPDRLVAILHHRSNPVAPANFLDWRRQSTAFERVGAAEYWTPNVTGGGNPEKVQALRLTTDALQLAGIQPALGRLFVAGEDEPGREHEAVLSWGFWQRRFGADRSILGRTITLDANAYTVVGVMPPGFDFPMFWAHDVHLWAPLALGTQSASREGSSLRVLAKLRTGVSLAVARAEIAKVTAGLERTYPGTNRDVHVYPLRDLVVGDVRPALLVLLGAVGFVLLLSCANVAHMLLARGAAREREITVRAALGAGRTRLVRQLLTESLLLGGIGGVIGLVLASYGVHALVALGGAGLPRAGEIGLNARVVVFTLGVSLATGLLFGMAPALRSSRAQLTDSLREGGRAGTGKRQHRLRDLLVASEFALALILLTGAGLAIRSFIALHNIDPGFDPRGVVTMVVSFTGSAEASPGRRVPFIEQLLARVRSLPGVDNASAINHVPIIGDNWGMPYFVEGRSVPKPGDAPTATYRVVLPGYFATMGVPILRGRDVAATDRLGMPAVVIINDFMARRLWPGDDPIGKRITLDRPSANSTWFTVVGIVKNMVRSDWAAPPEGEIFVPWLQEENFLTNMAPHVGYMTLVVRARCGAPLACDAAPLVPEIRNTVWSFDRNLPVSEVRTMDAVVQMANARPRFTLVLLAVFAGVALLLAGVGIYGVMSYAVARRTHEIGIRLALGAAPGAVVRMVVREGMVVALIGAAAGVASALLLTRSMASFLYGVQPSDPLTLGAVSLVLIGAALVATYLPARQAARTDPPTALRGDG
ncbi:MAG TPA: ABC transporter permease [Gemmatimonadaceae bacterium]|jgi:putative ABC transport system permease protein